jgi:transcriptional regulator with XRE-family HTH domain
MARTNRVKELRMARGWTQTELSKKSSIKTRSVISDIETHRHTLKRDEIQKLANVFEIEPERLFKED